MTKPGGNLRPTNRRCWTDAERALLRQQYADTLTPALAAQLGRSVSSVSSQAALLGLRKNRELIVETARKNTGQPGHGGQACRFQPGLTPWNKGKPFQPGGRSAETRFKPGARPHTWLPVGTFRITKDGILEQKYSDAPGPANKRWRNYSQIVWERAHGAVPKGFIVIFRPGQRTTDPEQITADKLELITRAENARRNSVHRHGSELARLAQLRGALTRQINLRERAAQAEEHQP